MAWGARGQKTIAEVAAEVAADMTENIWEKGPSM